MRKSRKNWTPEEYVEMWRHFQEYGRKGFKQHYGFGAAHTTYLFSRLKRAVRGDTLYGKEKLGQNLIEAGRLVRAGGVPTPRANEVHGRSDAYNGITEAFDRFKEDLVKALVIIVKQGQEKEKRDAYKRGVNEGRIEEQKKFLEEAKRSNIGDMFRRHLTGGA